MLNTEEMNAVCAHALQEYPLECCGIVTGNSKGEDNRVHKCRNIQNMLHEQDPEQYPRDARTAYYIDPRESMRIMNEAADRGDKIVGFYHSHPDHDAYFSDTDRDRALMDGEPLYPEAEYLVVSVYEGEVKGTVSFQWDAREGTFVARSRLPEKEKRT